MGNVPRCLCLIPLSILVEDSSFRNYDRSMATAKTTNLWVSNEGVRMRKQGRAGQLEGLLAACLSPPYLRPSFSLMSNLPLLTPTDCTQHWAEPPPL